MSDFYFSEKHASRAVRFFETQLRYVSGKKAGQPFVLAEWQRKIVRDLFGWLRTDGTRRYRLAYIEVPRKNGKSTFAAGIALYLLLCDGEKRPQVYSAAGDRDQARIVFNTARDMVAASPEIGRHAELRQFRINALNNTGWYEACSAEAYSGHGKEPHGIIFDELHVQKTRQLYDTMLSGRGSRAQPLVVMLTTAGFDRSSICWEVHQRAEAAIADPDSDPTFYGVIYGAAVDDDWTSEEVWAKANPNLGVSVSLEFLREECAAARQNPAAENTFRNLYLNQWTEQAVRWISMQSWDLCDLKHFPPETWLERMALTVRKEDAVKGWEASSITRRAELLEESLIGRTCFAALDLASTRDTNALVLLFPNDDGTYYLLPYFWVPADSKSDRTRQDRTRVLNFAKCGLIKTTDGNQTDYYAIADDIMSLSERFFIQYLAYDPWGPATAFIQILQSKGFPFDSLKDFRQTIGNFAAPSKEFERLVVGRKLIHNGDQVLRWMVSNVAAKRDLNDNIRPDKEASADKIDGVVATIMALGLAITYGVNGPSFYLTNELEIG